MKIWKQLQLPSISHLHKHRRLIWLFMHQQYTKEWKRKLYRYYYECHELMLMFRYDLLPLPLCLVKNFLELFETHKCYRTHANLLIKSLMIVVGAVLVQCADKAKLGWNTKFLNFSNLSSSLMYWLFVIKLIIILNLYLWHLDIDECVKGDHNCSEYAKCKNLYGGYSCECLIEFEGDGETCTRT